jgi:hypothetical protein
MLIDGLIALIQESETVNTTGGVNENVLPRGYVLPAYVIHSAGGTQDTQFSGPVDIREDDIQFDCYGRTAIEARQCGAAVRTLLSPYVGTLPDGTIVQRVNVEMDMAMPYSARGDEKGLLDRWLLKLHFISKA